MKKAIISLFILLPIISIAQEEKTHSTIKKQAEIGISSGLGLRTQSYFNGAFENNIVNNLNNSLSILFLKNNFQFGIRLAINLEPRLYTEFQPTLITNHIIKRKNCYYYLGGALGFASRKNIMNFGAGYTNQWSNGYVFGLQTGIVYHISKHLSAVGEVALRSTQYFNREKVFYSIGTDLHYYTTPINYFEASLPIQLGFRYRF